MQDRRLLAVVGLLTGLAIGSAATIPAAILAVASAGAGHGNYWLARLLFPYSMLLTRFVGDEITPPLIALALAQLPLYGASIGLAVPSRSWRNSVVVAVLAVHSMAAGASFAGLIPTFS